MSCAGKFFIDKFTIESVKFVHEKCKSYTFVVQLLYTYKTTKMEVIEKAQELTLPGTQVALNAQSPEIAFEQIELLCTHYGKANIKYAEAQLENFLKTIIKYMPVVNPQCYAANNLLFVALTKPCFRLLIGFMIPENFQQVHKIQGPANQIWYTCFDYNKQTETWQWNGEQYTGEFEVCNDLQRVLELPIGSRIVEDHEIGVYVNRVVCDLKF